MQFQQRSILLGDDDPQLASTQIWARLLDAIVMHSEKLLSTYLGWPALLYLF